MSPKIFWRAASVLTCSALAASAVANATPALAKPSGVAGAAGVAAPAAHTMSWETALARAAQTGESILVEVGATWCHACIVLATRTLADSTVQDALSSGWIVVHVDVDRRPDLHRLFHARGHDGLPTLHVLDPNGEEVLRSGFVDAPALVGMLRTARRHPSSQPLLPPPTSSVTSSATLPMTNALQDTETTFTQARGFLFAEEDTTWGGFGRGTKYIVAPETDFLIALVVAGDEAARTALRRFVAAVTTSNTHDSAEGGFHRYSEATDWSRPHYEKLLMVQAVMLEALATDAKTHPAVAPRNEQLVRKTWDFLRSSLLDPGSGLFFASLGADVVADSAGADAIIETGDAHYGRPTRFGMVSRRYRSDGKQGGADGRGGDGDGGTGVPQGSTPRQAAPRRAGPRPAPDRILLTDANARLASALLLCGDTFRDPSFVAAGQRLGDAIQAELQDPELGLLRYRGLDGSGAAAVEDLAEVGMLWLAAGNRKLDVALAVGETLLDRYMETSGRLRPRPAMAASAPAAPVAHLGDDGARAVVFLARLAATTGDRRFLDAAQDALRNLATALPEPAPASLGLATQAILVARATMGTSDR